MKFKEFLLRLQLMAIENPSALDYEVIYCIDDEGNGYDTVKFAASIGKWDGAREFDSQDYDHPNCVCIN